MFFNPIVGEDAIRTRISDFLNRINDGSDTVLLVGKYIACYTNLNIRPKQIDHDDYYDEEEDHFNSDQFVENVLGALDTLRFGGMYWLAFDVTSGDEHHLPWVQSIAFELCIAFNKASSFALATTIHNYDDEQSTPFDIVGLAFISQADLESFATQHIGQDYTNHPLYGFDLWKRRNGII